MIERFFLTVKQECIWLDRYDADRPHSALGYLTPQAYREKSAA